MYCLNVCNTLITNGSLSPLSFTALSQRSQIHLKGAKSATPYKEFVIRVTPHKRYLLNFYVLQVFFRQTEFVNIVWFWKQIPMFLNLFQSVIKLHNVEMDVCLDFYGKLIWQWYVRLKQSANAARKRMCFERQSRKVVLILQEK